MKKRKTWQIWILVSLVILTIFGLLFACGFRVTYSPELESNWEAIGAVAGWVSALAASAAVVAAVAVAKKQAEISEQQNRIALFEKRFELYDALCSIVAVYRGMERIDNVRSAVILFLDFFGKDNNFVRQNLNMPSADLGNYALDAFEVLGKTLEKANFLLEYETEIYLAPVRGTLLKLLCDVRNDDETVYLNNREEFITAAKRMEAVLLPRISMYLYQIKGKT